MRSRVTTSIAPDSIPFSSRSRPSASIASVRQSPIAWPDQRVIGDLAFARKVLGAGDLVGKDRADQVLGAHARELRRHLAAAERKRGRASDTPATQRQRVVNIGESRIAWVSTVRAEAECR